MGLRCDHFIRATPDVDAAYATFARLGLSVSPPRAAPDPGTRHTVVRVGAWPETMMFVAHVDLADRDKGLAEPATADLVPLLEAGGGMRRLAFAADDLEPVRRALADQPGGFTETVGALGGEELRTITPGDVAQAGCRFKIVQYPASMGEIQAASTPPPGDFRLMKVDHVAIIQPDFEACTRYWTEVLSLPMVGEFEGPGFVVRQIKAGEMIVELLKSTSDDGPLASRKPGLQSTLACQVEDIDAAVALARARGFNPRGPRPGTISNTRIAVIQPEELSGMGLQLMQYA
jgi:catechol 2,3-dioxygenase-like lactoylglutathione lyase family enzyme